MFAAVPPEISVMLDPCYRACTRQEAVKKSTNAAEIFSIKLVIQENNCIV